MERTVSTMDDDAPNLDPTPSPEPPDDPLFLHPEWMVGIVLICGALAIVAGLANPVWWIIGSPAILALCVWAYGRTRASRNRTDI